MRTKLCPDCKITKPITEYYINKSRLHKKGYAQAYCKICQNIRAKNWVKDNKEKYIARYKRLNIWNKHGITLEERDEILRLQDNRCAICLSDKPTGHGWHVDHDKYTGKIRGILCSNCNTGIGLLDHDIETLVRAANYLVSRNE